MQIVDSLIVTLGIDASDFVKGQGEAEGALGKTKQSVDKSVKDMEAAFSKAAKEAVKTAKTSTAATKDMSEGFAKATSGVLTLMAAFLGGQGLKQFIGDAVRANTALGNVSATLGTSSQFVSAWSMAAERMGGSAAATQGSLQALSDSLINLNAKGKTPPVELFMLEADSKKHIDLAHGLDAYTISLASASHELAKTDPAKASNFLRALGIDPVTANLLIKQGDNMRSYLQTMKRLAPSDRDVKVSSQLTESWSRLSQQFSLLASKIATAIGPALIYLADKIGMVVEAVARWVEANPGLTTAIVGFIGLLSAGGILLAIKNILGLAGALRALAAANELTAASAAGGGLIGLISRFALAVGIPLGLAAAGLVASTSPAGEGEDEAARRRKYGTDTPLGDHHAHGEGADAIRRRARKGGHDQQGGWWTPERQQHAYDVLRDNGVSERGAIALVSRWKNVESTSRGPDDENAIGGGHLGIYQASRSRAAHFGFSHDFDAQLKAAAAETRGGDGMGAGGIFDTAKTDAEAARGAAVFERAEGWNGRTDNYAGKTESGMEAVRRTVLRPKTAPPPAPSSPKLPPFDPNHPPLPAPPPFHSKTPPMALWSGSAGARMALRAGAQHTAALNNVSNQYKASTTTNSNEAHVQNMVINTQATDAHGIARRIDEALAHNLFANYANVGPA